MKRLYDSKVIALAAMFKDADAKKGIVTGYFSAFGNVDSQGDIMRPGAYAKSITENGPTSAMPRIKHLLNHNTTQPLGKIQVLKEDTTGLYYESQTGTHKLGKDFIDMVESGLITEHSVAFKTLKQNRLQSYEDYRANPKGGWFEITEVKLYEGSSLTAWGANEMTPLTGMKSAEYIETLEKRIKSLEKFCRNSDASDETIELLLLECKQLTQLLIDTTTEPENKSTLPENEVKSNAVIDTIQHYLQTLN